MVCRPAVFNEGKQWDSVDCAYFLLFLLSLHVNDRCRCSAMQPPMISCVMPCMRICWTLRLNRRRGGRSLTCLCKRGEGLWAPQVLPNSEISHPWQIDPGLAAGVQDKPTYKCFVTYLWSCIVTLCSRLLSWSSWDKINLFLQFISDRIINTTFVIQDKSTRIEFASIHQHGIDFAATPWIALGFSNHDEETCRSTRHRHILSFNNPVLLLLPTQENPFVRQRREASSDLKNMQLMVSSMKINIKNQNHMRQLKEAL